jgi:hypothetical protein
MISSKGPVVNTKNWYRREADLWAEFGNKFHSTGKISSEDSTRAPAVGNTSSFGKRTVCAEFSRMRDGVARNRRKG